MTTSPGLPRRGARSLVGELPDLRGAAPGVGGQQALALLGGIGLESVKVGVEHHLGVDREPAAPRQPQDHVRTDRAAGVAGCSW
jgi:hypothetical protein